MKKYAIIFALAFLLTTLAFKVAAGPCEEYATLVRSIGESRQAGVPIEQLIGIARDKRREDLIPLIIRAYKGPRYYAVKAYQEREISDLVTSEYIRCLEAENEVTSR